MIGRAPMMVKTPNGPVFMGGWNICDADLVAGRYDCQNAFHFSVTSGVAWDPARSGIWNVDPRRQYVRFLRREDGIWQLDDDISGAIPNDILAGMTSKPGICVVPDGTILVWSKSADLYRWDGNVWSVVSAADGPPFLEKRRVVTKWSWDDEAQACIGGSGTAEGLWVYKPAGPGGSPLPLPVPSPQPNPIPGPLPAPLPDPGPASVPSPAPTPAPKPQPLPNPKPAPVEGVDLEAKWSIDRDNLPSIDGVAVRVAAWQPAPWDQPIERLAGAPDYDAICAGEWAELHYRTNADLAGSNWETQDLMRAGTPNVRIYLYPLKNAAGGVVAYTEDIKGRSQCLEVIGVPDAGRKPQTKGKISLQNGRGLILRGLLLAEGGNGCASATGNKARLTQPAFVVIHDSEFYACAGHVLFFGVASRKMPPTYLEMIGNVTAYARSHAQYNERARGSGPSCITAPTPISRAAIGRLRT